MKREPIGDGMWEEKVLEEIWSERSPHLKGLELREALLEEGCPHRQADRILGDVRRGRLLNCRYARRGTASIYYNPRQEKDLPLGFVPCRQSAKGLYVEIWTPSEIIERAVRSFALAFRHGFPGPIVSSRSDYLDNEPPTAEE